MREAIVDFKRVLCEVCTLAYVFVAMGLQPAMAFIGGACVVLVIYLAMLAVCIIKGESNE